MHPDLVSLAEAANGLLYTSESDHPLVVFQLEGEPDESRMRRIAGQSEDAQVEKVTLAYFFRNQVRSYSADPPQQKLMAERFKALEMLIHQKLRNVKVWRVGKIQIDAFVLGQLSDGTWAGLRTKLVET